MITFNYAGLFNPVNEEEDNVADQPSAPVFSDRWKWFSIIETSRHDEQT